MEEKQQKKIGALLSNENHIWFHKQNKSTRNYMNAIFQEYKRQVDECKVVFVDDLEVPFEIKSIEFNIDEKGKFNRTKTKRETQKIIKEYYEEEK